MNTQIRHQTTAFIRGFRSIINPDWLSLFSTSDVRIFFKSFLKSAIYDSSHPTASKTYLWWHVSVGLERSAEAYAVLWRLPWFPSCYMLALGYIERFQWRWEKIISQGYTSNIFHFPWHLINLNIFIPYSSLRVVRSHPYWASLIWSLHFPYAALRLATMKIQAIQLAALFAASSPYEKKIHSIDFQHHLHASICSSYQIIKEKPHYEINYVMLSQVILDLSSPKLHVKFSNK